ncbi:MAG TPA: BON domain-containing protein [Candidatus Binatia bacterium]|nr:BON domain-containing protein [Candidatus Binatia bacterium]
MCGNISENHHAFCAKCGADLKRLPAADKPKEDKAEVDAAPPPKRELPIPPPVRKKHSESAEANGYGISSIQLPEEILKVHADKGNPQPYRKPLYESTQFDSRDESTAETWVDANGEEERDRAGMVAGLSPETPWRFKPPETDQTFGTTLRAPGKRKARGRIAKIALLSLAVVVGLIALSEIYEIDTSDPLGLLLRQLPTEYVRKPEVPRSPQSVPLKQPEQKEALRDEDAAGSAGSPLPQIETSRRDNGKPTSGTARPIEKGSGEREAGESIAARRQAIEHAIGRAIQQRAVEGVTVAFVNDTAYLTGAVLSENQKAAAEQAARNVPGVKRVRNSISVTWTNR